MNTERLREISDWLKADAPEKNGVAGFYMPLFWAEKSCGTVCCIGGTAAKWWGENPDIEPMASAVGRDILGLSDDAADELFFVSRCMDVYLTDITPAWAARCIDHLIATGVVDWKGTRNEPQA